ncbi:hypothetical protein WAI453_001288 [Rhynchosporium graminicola]
MTMGMANHEKGTKRMRAASKDGSMEGAACGIQIPIYNNGPDKNPFRPPGYIYSTPRSTEVASEPDLINVPASQPEHLICEYCHMTFENKDLLLGHRLRTPHGFTDEGKITIVPPGSGLDDHARIITPSEGQFIDEYSNIARVPALSNLRAPSGPEVVNPPPFFEPGCPATGVFLPVGTRVTLLPGKPPVWYCPWKGCDKKNWKIWRLNRHINTTHVAVRRSYHICNCGQAYATMTGEEDHRTLTGHVKAI